MATMMIAQNAVVNATRPGAADNVFVYECDLVQCHAFFDPYVVSSPDGSLSDAAEFRDILVNIDYALAQGLQGKKLGSPEMLEAVLKDVEGTFATGQRLSFQDFHKIIRSLYEIRGICHDQQLTLLAELTSSLSEAIANKEDTADIMQKLKEAAHELDMLDGKEDGAIDGKKLSLDATELSTEWEIYGVPAFVFNVILIFVLCLGISGINGLQLQKLVLGSKTNLVEDSLYGFQPQSYIKIWNTSGAVAIPFVLFRQTTKWLQQRRTINPACSGVVSFIVYTFLLLMIQIEFQSRFALLNPNIDVFTMGSQFQKIIETNNYYTQAGSFFNIRSTSSWYAWMKGPVVSLIFSPILTQSSLSPETKNYITDSSISFSESASPYLGDDGGWYQNLVGNCAPLDLYPGTPPNETSSAINGMGTNPDVNVTPQVLTNQFGTTYDVMVNGSSSSKNVLMFVKLRQVRTTYGECYTAGPTAIPYYNSDLKCVQPYSEAVANTMNARPELNESYYDGSIYNYADILVPTRLYSGEFGDYPLQGGWYLYPFVSDWPDRGFGILYSSSDSYCQSDADSFTPSKFIAWIDRLQKYRYLDELTAMVEVSFQLYNPNSNVLHAYSYRVEMTPEGAVFPDEPSRSAEQVNAYNTVIVYWSIVFGISTLVNECANLFMNGFWGYIQPKGFWKFAIIYSWTLSITILLANTTNMAKYANLPGLAPPNTYLSSISYSIINAQQDGSNTMFAVVNFLLVMKYLKMFMNVPGLSSLGRTLFLSIPQMSVFLIVLVFVIFAFTLSFTQLFCDSVYEFRDLFNAMFTTFRSLKGDFPDLIIMQKRQGSVAQLFFLLYIVTILFTVMSILISIMSASYQRAQADDKEREAEEASGSFMMIRNFIMWIYDVFVFRPTMKLAMQAIKSAKAAANNVKSFES